LENSYAATAATGGFGWGMGMGEPSAHGAELWLLWILLTDSCAATTMKPVSRKKKAKSLVRTIGDTSWRHCLAAHTKSLFLLAKVLNSEQAA